MKLERLLAILLLLLKEERMTADFLADRFEVTKRTIYRDMESLMLAGIPIVTYSGKGGGYSLMESYKLKVFTFTEEEKQLLLHSLDFRQELLGNNHVDELQQKLIQLTNSIPPASIRLSSPSVYHSVLDEELKERMQYITKAIDLGKDIAFQYVSYKGDYTERTIRPYSMVLRNGSWYVEGYCYLRKEERVFKLSRMRALEMMEAREQPIQKDESNEKPLFQSPLPPMNIQLQFHKSKIGIVYDYFSLEDIQEITEEHVRVSFTFHHDYSIIPFILSFGKTVQIMEPKELKEQLLEELKLIKKIYES